MKEVFSILKRLISRFCCKAIFWVLPAVFFILAMLVHSSYGKFYMTIIDPEYFHLFNGLNLAIFNLAVDYIAHPGTTVQVIYALSAQIVNLAEPSNDLIKNAMDHPEDFILGANILLNLITVICLFVAGKKVYSYTGNVFLALMVQLIPFLNFRLLNVAGRMLPEAALTAPLLLLILLVIKYVYDHEASLKQTKYIIAFAVIGGLGMAGKFLYLPFLIIPLFLFPTKKSRLTYLAYTVVATLIFAFPVTFHPVKAWEWFGSMLTHSGQWGKGGADFIETNEIPSRLRILFTMDKALFVIAGIALVQLMVFAFIPALKRLKELKVLQRVLFAVLVSFMLSTFLVVKHFAYHYYYPTLLLKGIMLVLMTIMIIKSVTSKKLIHLITLFSIIVMIILSFGQIAGFSNTLKKRKELTERKETRHDILKKYNTSDNHLIISSNYKGSPFIQSALVGGFLMSGRLKSTYIEYLAQKYPTTAFYYPWTKRFYLWDKFVGAKDFISQDKPLYLFIGEGKEKDLKVILERIRKDYPNRKVQRELVYHFTAPEEYFYKINLLTSS